MGVKTCMFGVYVEDAEWLENEDIEVHKLSIFTFIFCLCKNLPSNALWIPSEKREKILEDILSCYVSGASTYHANDTLPKRESDPSLAASKTPSRLIPPTTTLTR
jgi:hypothetical protein